MSWAAEQLTAFVAAVSGLEDETTALRIAAEQAAEALDADVVAVLTESAGVVAAVGLPRGAVPDADLRALLTTSTDAATLPGLGACRTLAVPFEGSEPGTLLVARGGDAPFGSDERNLLRGMGRVLSMSLRTIRVVVTERALRDVLRGISTRQPLNTVLQSIIDSCASLLGVDVCSLRTVAADDPRVTDLRASTLPADVQDRLRRRAIDRGASGRAVAEGRLIIEDDYSRSTHAHPELLPLGLGPTMAAPVIEDGSIAGSLVVGSRNPRRRYSHADQQTLLAFAEHASLALTDAKTVQALLGSLERARHDAMHDPLTRLPNRSLLRDRLDQALRRSGRHGTQVCLLFLDLDGFKRVNDSLGHDAGDQLLAAVAERLADAVRDVDTVARLGGDEFALLLEDISDSSAARRLAEGVAGRVFTSLREPFTIGGRTLELSASIGIAFADQPGCTSRELLRNADLAMYEAKAAGKDQFAVFRSGMFQRMIEDLELEAALRVALERDEFVIHYQPIVDLNDGRVLHVEALVRWRHPTDGLIGPDRFIPVAESSGLISQLGDVVLSRACHQVAAWQEHGRIGLSVNLSPRQLDDRLPARVGALLAESGLPPSLLTLEITEGLLMDNGSAALSVIGQLRRLGVHFAIDDFGMGYSSLGRLSQLPVDQLKIDRSFIRGLPGSPVSDALVAGVIALADGLGLSVVAEGVETAEQREVLLARGCPAAQGYLFSRPVPASELGDLLPALLRGSDAVALPRQRAVADGAGGAGGADGAGGEGGEGAARRAAEPGVGPGVLA